MNAVFTLFGKIYIEFFIFTAAAIDFIGKIVYNMKTSKNFFQKLGG